MIASSVVMFSLIGESTQRAQPPRQPPAVVRLATLSWAEAESRLRSDTVVVLPLGAGSVQHGPHLPLDTDHRLVEHLTRVALDGVDVVIAPTFSYHYYPWFVEYPGSTSLSSNTARDLTADVVRSLSRFGPRRFYVLNTSPASIPALAEAAKIVTRDGVLLRYTDPLTRLDATIRQMQIRQPFGNHADDVETSMMLHVDAGAVDMSKARTDLGAESMPFHLTRRSGGRGTYSPTGTWGDATLATAAKGSLFVDALSRAVRADIEDLRRSTPPVASGPGPALTPAPAPPRPQPAPGRPGECLAGDDRQIRGLGPAFASAWARQDANALAALWNSEGDMVHPDGLVEGSAQIILENRTALFAQQAYRGSRHGLYLGQIRCISADIAIADATWDLRGVTDSRGMVMPAVEGLSTLVLKRRGADWGIEAYRYSMKNARSTTQPTLLNRPGFTDSIK